MVMSIIDKASKIYDDWEILFARINSALSLFSFAKAQLENLLKDSLMKQESDPVGIGSVHFRRKKHNQTEGLKIPQAVIEVDIRDGFFSSIQAQLGIDIISLLHEPVGASSGGLKDENVGIIEVGEEINVNVPPCILKVLGDADSLVDGRVKKRLDGDANVGIGFPGDQGGDLLDGFGIMALEASLRPLGEDVGYLKGIITLEDEALRLQG
jgi:hypothetical protein